MALQTGVKASLMQTGTEETWTLMQAGSGMEGQASLKPAGSVETESPWHQWSGMGPSGNLEL